MKYLLAIIITFLGVTILPEKELGLLISESDYPIYETNEPEYGKEFPLQLSSISEPLKSEIELLKDFKCYIKPTETKSVYLVYFGGCDNNKYIWYTSKLVIT
ncbi:MAG: hypothetical protein ACRCYT_01990 [Cetobacterium sp.]